MIDYYQILDVNQTNTVEEIKKSYRKIVIQYQPDKNSEDALYKKKIKFLNDAYEVLCDSDRRNRYDIARNTHNDYGIYINGEIERAPFDGNDTTSLPITILLSIKEIHSDIIELFKETNLSNGNRSISVIRPLENSFFQDLEYILKNNIGLLIRSHDTKINRLIVEEVLFCFEYFGKLSTRDVILFRSSNMDSLEAQLIKLAGSDTVLEEKIIFVKKKFINLQRKRILKVLGLVALWLFIIFVAYRLSHR